MRIGIDISQIVYEGTGVAEYTKALIRALLENDLKNKYILFYSNHRRRFTIYDLRFTNKTRAKYDIKQFSFPIILLEFLWNKLHIVPIEWFIGPVDVYFSSDWVEPPTIRAKKVTTIHDLSVLKFPDTFDKKIVSVHKRKLNQVKKHCNMIICDSESTKKDCMELLHIPEEKLMVVYPGIK